MKNGITIVTIISLFILGASSCIKETSRADAFVASFELNTPDIYSGDEFQFTITSNHNRFKVVEFSFPLAPSFVTVGETYTTDADGRWRPHAIVPVNETRVGKISISIQDEKTQNIKTFSAIYHAYKATPITLSIDNSPLASATTKIRNTTSPLIVSGEPLGLTLKASGIDHLTVKEFKCEFGNEALPKGKNILFDKNGEYHISIPTSFSEDSFNEESTLSITLKNEETGRDTTMTASYIKALPFLCEISLFPTAIIEGDDVTMTVKSSRQNLLIENINKPSWFLEYQVENGSTLKLDSASEAGDYYYTHVYTSSSEKIVEDVSGEITLSIKDMDYTGRTLLFTLPYTASTQKDPSNIKTSRDNTFFRISEDSVNELKIWTTDEKSNNIFVVSCPSSSTGKVTFYCPKPDETTSSNINSNSFEEGPITITNNRVFFKATGTAGNLTISITTKEGKVKKDLSGYVKQSVAVVLAGRFKNDMNEHFGNPGGRHYTGWFGFPDYIEAKLYRIDNWSAIKNITSFSEETVDDIKLTRITENNSLSLKTTVRVGKKVTSYYHYYAYYTKKSKWWDKCPSPESALLNAYNKKSYHEQFQSEQPSALFKTMTEASSNPAGEVNCEKLRDYLRDMDCVARIGWCCGLADHDYTNIDEDHLKYEFIEICVTDVHYNTDIYDLKYYINKLCDKTFLTTTSSNTGPWWHLGEPFTTLDHNQDNIAIPASEL